MVKNSLSVMRPDLAKQVHPTKNHGLTADDIPYQGHMSIWWIYPYDVPMDYPVKSLRGRHFDFEWQAIVYIRGKSSECPYLHGYRLWQGFNDLETVNPELAKQFHPSKNGSLTAKDIPYFSAQKVWWLLPYDVPDDYPVESLRGKHFDFEWEATVHGRTIGRNCPYLSGFMVYPGFNDLATVNPELAKQVHPTKNNGLTASDFTANSHKKIWWLYSYDDPKTGKHFDFEWQTTIQNRMRNLECPYLNHHKIWPGFNDLATVNPELAAQFHPYKNGELTTKDVLPCSVKKIWWLLPYDVPDDYPVKSLRGKHFDFEWQASINHRSQGDSCPYLVGKKVYPGFNDLATINPELAKQLHPLKNHGIHSETIYAYSTKSVWWIYPYDDPKTGRHFDFEWQETVDRRMRGRGCPYLSGKRIYPGFNDLATANPELAKQVHPTKNNGLTATDIAAYSNKNIWWIYPYDDPKTGKHFDFEWQTTPASRINSPGCPFLSSQRIWPGFNDLKTRYPEIASEWNYELNKGKPEDYMPYSTETVWWTCLYNDLDTGEQRKLNWRAKISVRVSDNCGCPYLTGRSVLKGFNDLAFHRPDLADEWDYKKNKTTPDKITLYSNKKRWWICPHCGKSWYVSPAKRADGQECSCQNNIY